MEFQKRKFLYLLLLKFNILGGDNEK